MMVVLVAGFCACNSRKCEVWCWREEWSLVDIRKHKSEYEKQSLLKFCCRAGLFRRD